METLLHDLRYAGRTLTRKPGFTLVAVLTLALGIGATTVIFSLINAILLRPLPVAEPDRLFAVQELRQGPTFKAFGQTSVSYPRYLDYRDRSDVFSGLVAQGMSDLALRTNGEAESTFAVFTSGNYFQVLGIRPQLGRLFTAGEDRAMGQSPVAVISHYLWQKRFGGDAAVIGRTVHLNSRPMTVVGVAPAGFNGTFVGVQPDVWVPISMFNELNPGANIDQRGRRIWLTMFGRLKPGVSPEQAAARLTIVGGQIEPEMASTPALKAVQLGQLSGIPMGSRGPVIGFMAVLLGTAGLVLLIACTNVAGMLLARAAGRRREIAIRLAMGAGRGRLVRQLVTESVLLFGLGGAAGLVLAMWLSNLLHAFQPPVPVRVVLDLGIDARVLGFALLVTLVTGVGFGLVPALQASRPELVPALKDGAAGRGTARTRLRSVFVVGQLAMSLLLLVAAGLFVRALQSALSADVGFEPDGVVVAATDLQPHGYDEERGREFYRQLVERVGALPGVESASLAAIVPLSGNVMSIDFEVPGYQPPPNGRRPETNYNTVGAGYFEMLRMPIVAGRSFSEQDRPGAPQVAVVNETMARQYWPGESAVGKQVRRGENLIEIVGVVRDSKYERIDERPTAVWYLPFGQSYSPRMMVHARTAQNGAATLAAIRRELRALDPNVPLQEALPMSSMIGITLFPQRIAAVLVGIFGMVGLLLAAVGLYGILAFHVGQRTQEIGIRMALGAATGDVLRMVVRHGLKLTGIGLGIGLLAAFGLTRVLSGLLFGVSATDPLTFIVMPLLLTIVAFVAAYLPARRATRVDPMVALRSE